MTSTTQPAIQVDAYSLLLCKGTTSAQFATRLYNHSCWAAVEGASVALCSARRLFITVIVIIFNGYSAFIGGLKLGKFITSYRGIILYIFNILCSNFRSGRSESRLKQRRICTTYVRTSFLFKSEILIVFFSRHSGF